MSAPPDLIEAYKAATYELDFPDAATLKYRIGAHAAALDDVLRRHGAAEAAHITAYNPRSKKQSAAENAAAHQALLDEVARLGKTYLHGRGRDPQGRWPTEPGLLILDLTRDEGIRLACTFDQHAYVHLALDRAPELVLVD